MTNFFFILWIIAVVGLLGLLPFYKVKEVVCKRWVLKKFAGITLPFFYWIFIFYDGVPEADTKRHEFVHVKQIKKYGWLFWYIVYGFYTIKYGYKNNPFEQEATKQ